MKMTRTIARLLFGLCWLFFGLNGFFQFMKPPETPMPAPAAALFQGLMGSGYMMQFISGTEVFVGVLLVTGLFVPLALAVIAPIIVNIVAFHIFANRENYQPAAAVLVFELFLVFLYRRAFAGVLSARYSDDKGAA